MKRRRQLIECTLIANILLFSCGSAVAIESFYIKNIFNGVLSCGEDIQQSCEPSGVTTLSSITPFNQPETPLLIINDKTPIGYGQSPVISVDLMQDQSIRQRGYLQLPGNTSKTKLEGITTSLDGKYIVAVSAFDRHDEADKQHGYNRIMAWDARQVISKSFEIDTKSSRPTNNVTPFKLMIQNAIEEHATTPTPYFKIEGITFAPNNKFFIAIREAGDTFQKYTFKTLILSAEYIESDGLIYVNGDKPLNIAADFTDAISKSIGKSVGISDIVYNKFDGRLYFLTSLENVVNGKKQLDSFLWSVAVNNEQSIDLFSLSMAKLVDKKSTFHFSHKAEGLAFLSAKRLIVVHDDDRELLPQSGESNFMREINQAYYTILDLVDEPEKNFPTVRSNSERRLWEDIRPSGRTTVIK